MKSLVLDVFVASAAGAEIVGAAFMTVILMTMTSVEHRHSSAVVASIKLFPNRI